MHFGWVGSLTAVMAVVSYPKTLVNDLVNSPPAAVGRVKQQRPLLLMGGMVFCSMLCEGALADWSGVYLNKVIRTPAAYSALGLLCFSGAMTSGRFFGDALTHRIGSRKMMQLSGLLVFTGLLLAAGLPVLPAVLSGLLLVGMGVACVVPVIYGWAGNSSKWPSAQGITTITTIGFIGLMVGPPLIGFVAQSASLRWALGGLSLLGLAIPLLMGKIPEQQTSDFR
jgi:MFS family permease